jgi:hypothetical protein
MQWNWSQHCPEIFELPVRYIWIIEFSPQVVLGHDEQTHWPRRSQHIEERFFDEDLRNIGVWSSIKWLSGGQIDELIGAMLQTIFEQSMTSLTKEKYYCLFFYELEF